MKKKFLGAVAVGVAATIALSGCNANSARGASNISNSAAKRADQVVSKIETLSDKDYKFPSVLGTDFFVEDEEGVTAINQNKTSQESTLGANNWRGFSNPQGAAVERQSKESARKIFNRSIKAERAKKSSAGYKARHYNINSLNLDSEARTQYLDKLDDLYALCADISAANAQCKTVAREIKEKSTEMKSLARELKSSNVRAEFRQFNKINSQLKKDMNKLYKDRGRLKSRVNKLPKTSSDINVESMTARYTTILNKLDSRLKLLNEANEGMTKLNQNINAMLGKSATASEKSTKAIPENQQNSAISLTPSLSEQTTIQTTDSPNSTEQNETRKTRRFSRHRRAPRTNQNQGINTEQQQQLPQQQQPLTVQEFAKQSLLDSELPRNSESTPHRHNEANDASRERYRNHIPNSAPTQPNSQSPNAQESLQLPRRQVRHRAQTMPYALEQPQMAQFAPNDQIEPQQTPEAPPTEPNQEQPQPSQETEPIQGFAFQFPMIFPFYF